MESTTGPLSVENEPKTLLEQLEKPPVPKVLLDERPGTSHTDAKTSEVWSSVSTPTAVKAKLDEMSLDEQANDKAIVSFSDALGVEHVDVQSLQKTVRHLSATLEVQMEAIQKKDEDRIRYGQECEMDKQHIKELEEKLAYSNKRIQLYEDLGNITSGSDVVMKKSFTNVEQELRQKVEQQNQRLKMKLAQTYISMNNQQAQLKRSDRALYRYGLREINLQILLAEQNAKNAKMKKMLQKLKDDRTTGIMSVMKETVRKSERYGGKFSVYDEEPPRYFA